MMNKKALIILSLLAFGLASCSEVKPKGDLVLWYDKPATDWYQALPIGNGTLGAMVYGGIVKEHLQLNENTLYSGEPGRNVKLDFTKSLPKIRQSIKAGDMKTVNEIIAREYLGRAQDCYQPFGDLELEFSHSDKVLGFKRELDLSSAVCRTSYIADQVRYDREIFASFPDKVIVLNIKANKKGSVSFKLALTGAHPTAKSTVVDGVIVMKGQPQHLPSEEPSRMCRTGNRSGCIPNCLIRMVSRYPAGKPPCMATKWMVRVLSMKVALALNSRVER